MLDTDLFAYTGFHFGIGTSMDSYLSGKNLRLAGFDDDQDVFDMRYTDITVSDVDDYQIQYGEIDTIPGNSGSPIYENTIHYIAGGLHTHLLVNGVSGGTRFTSIMYQFFCQKIDYSKDFFGYSS